MTHRKWIRYIHLHREGELTAPEVQALGAHLAECESCRSAFEDIRLDWIQAVGEMGGEPVSRNPGRMVETVMATVTTSTGTSPVASKLEPRAQLTYHRVRLGLQLASLLILAIFVVEQMQVTHSRQSLEKRMQTVEVRTQYSQIRILPPLFRKQLLILVKDQLEKRGAPTKRIESLLNDYQAGVGASAQFLNRRRDVQKVQREVFEHLATMKAMMADGRQS